MVVHVKDVQSSFAGSSRKLRWAETCIVPSAKLGNGATVRLNAWPTNSDTASMKDSTHLSVCCRMVDIALVFDLDSVIRR